MTAEELSKINFSQLLEEVKKTERWRHMNHNLLARYVLVDMIGQVADIIDEDNEFLHQLIREQLVIVFNTFDGDGRSPNFFKTISYVKLHFASRVYGRLKWMLENPNDEITPSF